ncbi:serine hydrolase domain-containing protein [Kitasatospora sp. NPDC093679]|uniref:serine hydrolase domain-containing protein n=1 Tax=Kitasatospora sp. NPDC093679 TaxID=3154983 RepID=UPI003432D771
MRRTPHHRLFAATLFAASVLAPMTPAPATTVHATTLHAPTVRAAGVGRYDPDDCPPDGLGPELTARLDSTIEDVRRQAGIPGVVVGLWMPGRGSYVRATGIADTATGRPMAVDSYVRIGSETKTFTVTALLELVDQHRVGLDDPISAYVDGVPDGGRITLRQLAEMRSGLFPYTFDPGAAFKYSNTNLVLLGLVVEKVSGQRLADFVQRRVLRPAHLRRTLFPRGAEFPEPHPRGYTDQTLSGAVEDVTDWNPSWAWAAGAMISDLQDLRRWAEVVATGRLLSPGTQAERLKTLPTGFPGTGYGLGIFETNGWIGHNGSIPGYETVTVYLPSQRATLVVMINTDVLSQGQEPSTLLARAITAIATPDNVYAGAVPPH